MSSSSTNASSDALPPRESAEGGKSRTRRRRSRRSTGPSWLIGGALVLCLLVISSAPISAGGVHRVPMLLLMAFSLLGLGSLAVGLATEGRNLRLGVEVVLPLSLLLIPILQSIPLPPHVRAAIDQNGSSLLSDNDIAPAGLWPLSLDPITTRVIVGRAAAALAIFVLAYHFASGQRRRHLLPTVIGFTGIAAVTIGLGHRILGIEKLYGILTSTWRTALVGPFVNSNHTAEFLELSAFVCLACSFLRPTAINRVGWMSGTFLCAGGALATLSRGSALALGAGVASFGLLRFLAKDDSPSLRRPRAPLVWGALLGALVILGGFALGAGQLIDRFRASSVGTDVRLQLWRDSLHVLAAHPFGIGRGAFDRVYPIYRSLKSAFPIRFAFVENEPLQLLIDCGWLLFAPILAATVFVGWRIARRGRHDRVEAALVAGLVAVLVHGVVDFGLETLGVLLPFTAVLATVLARTHTVGASESIGSRRSAWAIMAAAGLGLLIGIVSLASPSADNFDALLKRSPSSAGRQALLIRAQKTHPLDYFYPLAYARLVPLKGAAQTASPRLHALNRALRLCPSCELVHVEIARNLWQLGLHRQALLEWRSAIQLNRGLMAPTLGELFSAGAKPPELVAIASYDPSLMVEVASFLSDRSKIDEAFAALDQADALGASRAASLIMRATLQVQAGRLAPAAATLESAHDAGIQDPRLSLLEAQLLLRTKGAAGSDGALAVLDAAAAHYPLNLEIQRARVGLVTNYQKWSAVARAMEGFKLALYTAQGSATEAHIANARIQASLGHLQIALGEYRVALADASSNPALWMEFGNTAAAMGSNTTAREAYATAARLSPNSAEAGAALRSLDTQQDQIRALSGPPPRENGVGSPPALLNSGAADQ
jgi:tetratricopeptide (TPR) repeat protein